VEAPSLRALLLALADARQLAAPATLRGTEETPTSYRVPAIAEHDAGSAAAWRLTSLIGSPQGQVGSVCGTQGTRVLSGAATTGLAPSRRR